MTGVATDNVLNIHTRPDAASDMIGSLAPDTTGIEVVAVSGNWALINSPEDVLQNISSGQVVIATCGDAGERPFRQWVPY